MQEIKNNDLDGFIEEGVTLVDFSATWCAPCRALKPTLKKLSDAGRKVCIVDVGDNQELATKYNVGSIPALLFFKDGELQQSLVGIQKEKVLNAIFDKLEG